MTQDRWREIEHLFNRALDMPQAERAAWLAQNCGTDSELLSEVQSLLANDNTGAETLLAPVKEAFASLPQSRGTKFAGPYQLIEELGRGGMGTVYKARRADEAYEAMVAVKLVRPGMDTDFVLARFRQERQTLAKLNHPNIARLLDGGATGDGVPYIVMEYIDGVRINAYCQREGLNLEQRLRLMLPICLAADYAHRNFIVHRDIKPGNIMVDSTGTPKLLDFGICKLLHANPLEAEVTMTKEMAMLTPDYASPEQILGESISIRSDVYSLGAVLYELLTGSKPHRFEKQHLLAFEEAICHAPVAIPSEAATGDARRLLRGDLDNIVMRALEKDPRRRYESAAALAGDIRRYLDHEPVSARPAGRSYRAGKFVRRHRALTLAIGAALVASAAGTVASVGQARRAEARERQIHSMARVFLYDVHDSVRDLPGATEARRKIVHTAVAYLDALAGSDPSEPGLLRELAAGYQRIADLQGSDARGANLGQARNALETYAKAVGHWEQLLRRVPLDTAAARERLNCMRRRADLLSQVEGQRASLPVYDQAEAEARGLTAQFPGDREFAALLGDMLTVGSRRSREMGDLALARVKGEEALTLTRRLAGDEPKNAIRLTALSSAETALGMTLARLGDLKTAAALYESAVARSEAITAAGPRSTSAKRNLMIGYSHLGDIWGFPDLPNLGEPARAEPAYSKMTTIARELAANDSNDARAATDLAIALMRWGVVMRSPPQRERTLRESLEIIEKRLTITPGNLTLSAYQAFARFHLGHAMLASGQRAGAIANWRRVVEQALPHFDKGNDSLNRALFQATRDLTLHEPLPDLRRHGAARVESALALAEKAALAKGTENVAARVQVARMLSAQSVLRARLGDTAGAAGWRQRAMEEWSEISSRPGFLLNYRTEMLEFERWRP